MKRIVESIPGGKRITVGGERWYLFSSDDYLPSITWIGSYCPKGIGYDKFISDKGYDEAQAIKIAAGIRGSKVHQAIETLIHGTEVRIDDKFRNPQTEVLEELTLEEYECLMAFSAFCLEMNPKSLATELVVSHRDGLLGGGFAGTMDWRCILGDEHWLLDFKTGQKIYDSHICQVSAGAHALRNADQRVDKTGILQIGYQGNKRQWKLTEIEEDYDLFLAARKFWWQACKNQKPLVRDYPESLKLDLTMEVESGIEKVTEANALGDKRTQRSKKIAT